MQRPESFTLDYSHSLARGLVFAGLGQSPGSVRYKDSSSRRNDGVLTNMIPGEDWTWVPELRRWVIQKSSSSAERIDFDTNVLGSASSASVSAWIKKYTASSGGYFLVSSSQLDYFTGYDWGIYQSSASQRFGWYVRNSSGSVVNSSESTASANGWHHVCGTYDGTFLRLFVDAKQVDADAQTGLVSTSGGFPLRIGGMWSYGYGAFDIADPLIHSRALSPIEISQLADPSNVLLSGLIRPPKRKYYVIKYHPTTARLLMLKQNNRFLSLQKI